MQPGGGICRQNSKFAQRVTDPCNQIVLFPYPLFNRIANITFRFALDLAGETANTAVTLSGSPKMFTHSRAVHVRIGTRTDRIQNASAAAMTVGQPEVSAIRLTSALVMGKCETGSSIGQPPGAA